MTFPKWWESHKIHVPKTSICIYISTHMYAILLIFHPNHNLERNDVNCSLVKQSWNPLFFWLVLCKICKRHQRPKPCLIWSLLLLWLLNPNISGWVIMIHYAENSVLIKPARWFLQVLQTSSFQRQDVRSWKLSKDLCLICWLVVSTPLKNISQLGWLFPIWWEHHKIHVPNHQPEW